MSLGDSTILIVDDEAIIAEDLRLRLQRLGHGTIGPVSNAREALGLARQQRPSLVLMDILLQGGMDGIDAATAMHKESGTPVLFVTACSDAPTIARARTIPNAELLIKPFDDRELEMALNLVLTRHALCQAERRNQLAVPPGIPSPERNRTAVETKKLRVLYSISEAVHATQSLDDLFQSIHRCVSEILPADNLYVALVDDQTGMLTFPYFVDQVDPPPPPRPLRKGLTEYVLRSGRPLFASPEKFEELARAGEIESMGAPSVDWMGVPLQIQGAPFGVLVVQSYSEGVRYSDEDMHILSFVSTQVAMAIDRTKKEQSLRRSEAELRGLFQSMEDIVLVFDAAGRYLNIAPSNPSLLYRPAGELLGRRLHEVFPREQADFFLEKITRTLAEGKRVQFEYPLEIHGKEYWFEASTTPTDDGRVVYIARNITHRLQMEQTLSETRENYRGIFENAAVGIAQRTLDGTFLGINPALVRMYGYDSADALRQEMSRRHGQLYVDADRRDQIERLIAGSLQGNSLESQVARKTGGSFWISEDYRLVNDAKGAPCSYIVIVQDITARKQAEREIRLLANTVACARDGFMLMDLEGRILFVNDALSTIFGRTAEDLVGKRADILCGGRLSASAVQEVFLPRGGSWNGETTGVRADGSEFPVELWTSPVRDETGRDVAFVTVARDVSERKRNEEVIRRNELRLRRITDTMLDMVVQIDTAGVCDYASPSITNVLGYPPGQVEGNDLRLMVHEEDLTSVEATFRRLREQKTPGSVEYRFRKASGEYTWLESIINPVAEESADVTGFVVGSVDISSRKRAEEALRLNEARLETLVKLNQMAEAPVERIVEFALEEAVRLTRSGGGFLTFLSEDGQEATSIVWSEKIRTDVLSRQADVRVDTTPLLAAVVGQRQPLILNDANTAAACFGELQPEGWTVARALCVPVLEGSHIVAIAAVGNKATGYDASDATQLTLLLEGMWLLIQRKRSQERMMHSLEEKELLLKEVHHRVKNNLQIISSLLSLQLGHVVDGPLVEILRESQNRIRSMALIHERLYRSGDLTQVDFGHYVRNLTSYLIRSYSSADHQIKVTVNIDGILLGVDLAIPCGLIVNELVTNSLRHAFVDGRAGEVRITMGQKESICRLTVHDNGVGLPEGLDMRAADSLGFQLIETLVDQIDGVIEQHHGSGTEFSIVFKAS